MRRSILPGTILLAWLVACDPSAPPAADPDAPHADAEPPAPDGTAVDAATFDASAGIDAPTHTAEGCSSIFDPAIVPEYHVTISPTEEAELLDEFLNRAERIEMGLPEHPWHPVELEVVLDGVREQPTSPVLLRLKGQSSWQQTVDLDENPKMQVVLAFNEVDDDGRFHGLRKVELDMPRTDWTFLKQRVALSYMREAGAYAQCANSARLYLNGAYYGLYTHLERIDKELLQRHFDEDDEGDLWKSGRYIETNEDHANWQRILELWGVSDVAGLDEMADLDASLVAWAVEAMVGDADGYYAGAPNFFIYDHPTRGYLWMPHDVDTVFDASFLPHDTTPVMPPPAGLVRDERFWHHYLIVMHDPAALQRYVDALAAARALYDVAALQERLDTWAAQIHDDAAADPHRPFSMETHDWGVARMREYIARRAEYIDAWLACWNQGGGADADGDGFDLCHDCDDADGLVYPGAVETCDMVDEDCDGHVDLVGEESVCAPPVP